jgi:hypothetical protein
MPYDTRRRTSGYWTSFASHAITASPSAQAPKLRVFMIPVRFVSRPSRDKLKTGASRNKTPLKNERMAAVAVTVLYVMINFTLPGSLQSRILQFKYQKNYTITPLHQVFHLEVGRILIIKSWAAIDPTPAHHFCKIVIIFIIGYNQRRRVAGCPPHPAARYFFYQSFPTGFDYPDHKSATKVRLNRIGNGP